MKYLDLINHFWEENRSNRFSSSECVLYFYLLNEANRKYWQMPFSCSTAIIVAETGLTKSTLTRAREGLRARGLISFKEGVQNSRAPTYFINEIAAIAFVTSNETACETNKETDRRNYQNTERKSDSNTSNDTASRANAAPLIKDKKKDKDKIKRNATCTTIPISDLEAKMKEDIKWQEQICTSLSSLGYAIPKDSNLAPYIELFFNFLRAKNVSEKEEGDCRQHFFNKLKKEYLSRNNYYGNNKPERNDRRGNLEVTTDSKENYEAAF